MTQLHPDMKWQSFEGYALKVQTLASLVAHSVRNMNAMQETICNVGDVGSISESGRSPGEGNGKPLQYSCLENPTNRGAYKPMAWKEWDATEHTCMYLNMILKPVFKKPIANSIFSCEYLKTFLRCLLSPLLFNILFPYPIYYAIPSQINQAGKNYTGIQTGNKDVKLTLKKKKLIQKWSYLQTLSVS